LKKICGEKQKKLTFLKTTEHWRKHFVSKTENRTERGKKRFDEK